MATDSSHQSGADLQQTPAGEDSAKTAAETVLQKTSLSLHELTPSTCGIATWNLRVVQPRVVEYTYLWQGQERKGKKLECILLSENSDSYCMGLVRRTGSNDAGERKFQTMVEKYNENTIWSMSRITLAQEKAQFIGSPVKYVIDMEKTKVTPVLQSTTFPRTPTPPDSLATIVELTRKQQVHFLALVRSVEKQRIATTARGERIIVDVTFVDGSKLANGKLATITTAMFLTKTKTGETLLKQLQDQTQPIVVVGAVCSPDSGKVNMSLSQDAYWFPCTSGAKAGHLMTMADELRTQQDIEEIGKEKTWTAQEARDFKAETATQTTCAILNNILQQEESVVETLFQLNHVRISEPGCGENIKTNDSARLFFPVRVLDFTGSVNLRMREQAAFELSGYSSMDEFETACRQACLRFPLLSSVRVLVRRKTAGASEHAAVSQTDSTEVTAIIVEATIQTWDKQSAPNAAVLELSAFLPHLSEPPSRMVVARLRDITDAPHAGMVVRIGDAALAADFVLVLIAVKERSGGNVLGTGYRVINKNVIDCNIWNSGEDITTTNDCVSICTMENLLHYKLAPPRPGGMQYALALVSRVSAATESRTGNVMIDYVEPIGLDSVEEYKQVLRKLATLARGAIFAASPVKRVSWSPSRTPYNAKKTRKLAQSPTDASLPDCGDRKAT